MKLTFHFKHLRALTSIEQYAAHRLEKLNKYEIKPLEARFIFGIQKHLQTAEVTIDGEHGRYNASATADGLYDAIDRVVTKLERQLGRRKEKVQHHRNKHHLAEILLLQSVNEEGPSEISSLLARPSRKKAA